MEIKHLKYKEIDFVKYDNCIDNAINSRVYAYSWYLDIVCKKNWEVLILGDYDVVMPLPFKIKYFIKYIYNPLWVLQLGVFSKNENEKTTAFIKTILKKYKLINLRLNTQNIVTDFNTIKTEKQSHFLLLKDYELLKKEFRSDRKKDLKRAVKFGLYENWTDTIDPFLNLYYQNLKKRGNVINKNDLKRLKTLLEICVKQKKGELLSIYDEFNNLVAAGFFLKHHKKITILISTTDLKNRNNGANTYLIDRSIEKYKSDFEIFEFGGSSVPSIANYFLSFSASEDKYFQIDYNNLPLIYKFFNQN